MIFTKPEQGYLDQVKPYLVKHSGPHTYESHVVKADGKTWFIKIGPSNEIKRDLLAFRLGRDWLNIPEVKLLTDAETTALLNLYTDFKLGQDESCILVRLGQDYSTNELVIKDLTRATASELVFSIWIRRRDAHSYNKVFVEGVPMFFDFHVAFAGEHDRPNYDVESFFTRHHVDLGFPSRWRVLLMPEGSIPDINTIREMDNRNNLSFQPIGDWETFKTSLQEFVNIIKRQSEGSWNDTINQTGLGSQETQRISKLLANCQADIDEAVARLLDSIVIARDHLLILKVIDS